MKKNGVFFFFFFHVSCAVGSLSVRPLKVPDPHLHVINPPGIKYLSDSAFAPTPLRFLNALIASDIFFG